MDHFIYSKGNENEDFKICLKIARYIQENRDNIIWAGGYYPRMKETKYRGIKAYREIVKNTGEDDVGLCSKFLKLLRNEYFCEGDWIRTGHKEVAEILFKNDEDIYIGKEEKAKSKSEDSCELINIINETELSSEDIKSIIKHLVSLL